jgi:hypothetical protein
MSRTLHITNVHDHQPVLLDLPALVFGTCSLLESIPVLVEARERSTISSSFLNIINSIMCHQDRDECRAMEHAEPHAPYRVPRRIPDR